MTGAGAPGAAGILKCLQQEKSFHITVADANPNAIGKYLNKDFETIPFANDPSFARQSTEYSSPGKYSLMSNSGKIPDERILRASFKLIKVEVGLWLNNRSSSFIHLFSDDPETTAAIGNGWFKTNSF